MKTRTSIKEIYHSVARSFACSRNYTPSHTDVRCAVNDELDGRSRDGEEVNFNYSQDAAFRVVRRVLCNIASNPTEEVE